MKVCAIIVCFNGRKWLTQCLGSVLSSSIPIDVIVVDNNSQDGSVNFIKDHFPKVRIIDSGQNHGFGKANNIALRMVLEEGYDYVLLLNQDAWIDPDVVSELIDVHRRHPQYGILSPLHLSGSGKDIDFRFSLSCNVIDCPDLISDLALDKLKEVYTIAFVNAAIWLLPISTISKVGLFDPIFPHYGEDVDYIKRLKFHRLYVGISPKLFGFHDRESRPASVKRDRVMRRLKYLCILKDINKASFKAFFSIMYVFTYNSLRALDKRQFVEVFYDIWYLIEYFFDLPAIYKARKASKKEGAFIAKCL